MERTITILNTQRAKSSKEGNPSYYVSFVERFGDRKFYFMAITGTNCQIGYQINDFIGHKLIVEFSSRKKLNLPVITQIKALGGESDGACN